MDSLKLVFVTGWLLAWPMEAQEIVSQGNLGSWACAPCAFYNAFASGDASHRRFIAQLPRGDATGRIRYLIEMGGKKPSLIYRNRLRYSEADGVLPEDLVAWINESSAKAGVPRVTGEYLDRGEDEAPGHQLSRICQAITQSIDRGFPPILELHAFAAQSDGGEWRWNGLGGHYVAVKHAGPLASGDPTGCPLLVADSLSGKIVEAYLHVEKNQPYTATRELSADKDGREVWHWISGYPYLIVDIPDVSLGAEETNWHTRVVTVARCLIGENGSASESGSRK